MIKFTKPGFEIVCQAFSSQSEYVLTLTSAAPIIVFIDAEVCGLGVTDGLMGVKIWLPW